MKGIGDAEDKNDEALFRCNCYDDVKGEDTRIWYIWYSEFNYFKHGWPICICSWGKKSDLFADHFEQIFNTTTSRTDLCKYMTFKVVKQLNPIGAMKTFTKPNCNLCMEERLKILKKIRDKRVTVMNKNLEIYGACRHGTPFPLIFPKHWWSSF